MLVQLQSTEKIVTLNDQPCRIWEGVTDSGIRVHAYIKLIAVRNDEPAEVHDTFKRELNEHKAPSPEVEAIPLRLIV